MQFNPSLWFVCKLCRESFPDTDKLNAHKLESHLGEILNIKCIVFEERLLDHEWTPSLPEFSTKQDQLLKLSSAPLQEANEDDLTIDIKPLAESKSQNRIELKNPYVSLKRLKTVDILNSTNSQSAFKIDTARPQSIVEKNFHFGLRETNSPNSPLPLKQRKTDSDGDDVDDNDDVQKTKIRELLSNVVLIKSEPCHDADDQACLESKDLPISILSTYSLPLSSSSSASVSTKTNPVNGNASFSSTQQEQQQQHHLHSCKNVAPTRVLPTASPILTIAKTLLKSQAMPTTLVVQPQQPCSYPARLSVNGQFIQTQDEASGNSTYFYQNETKNLCRLKAKSNVPTTTPEPPPAESPLKVEFIDYADFIAQNPNVEIISIESEDAQKMLLVNSHLELPLKSDSNKRPCPGPRRDGRQSNKIQKHSFVCQICAATFNTRDSLTGHTLSHSQITNKPIVTYRYQCPHCDSNFATRNNVRVHLIARHGGASAFRCHFCDKSLPSKAGLISHEAGHCDFPNCAVELGSKTALYIHKRTVHREEFGH